MLLVSLEAAKADLQMDHDVDDDDIEMKIAQASEAVNVYLNLEPETYLNSIRVVSEVESSGEPSAGADGEPDVQGSVRSATLLMVRYLYEGGEKAASELEHGYLPRPVLNLLYPLRTPNIG